MTGRRRAAAEPGNRFCGSLSLSIHHVSYTHLDVYKRQPIQTAEYMASLIRTESEKVKILDPGAGYGLLTAAVVEHLIARGTAREISVVLLSLIHISGEQMESVCSADFPHRS